MNESDTKLFVFTRKEVALIFLIVLSLSVTTFALGVKFGKRYYLQLAGIQATDIQEVELKSVEEEKVGKLMNQREEDVDEYEVQEENTDSKQEQMHEKLKNKIISELKVQDGSGRMNSETSDIVNEAKTKMDIDIEKSKSEQLVEVEASISEDDKYRGRYTIQLGSHRSINEAEDFANGFKIRGYSPIITEVQLKGTGTWFRVSLGSFDTVSSAKEYVLKERSLFEGQDYLFVQFD